MTENINKIDDEAASDLKHVDDVPVSTVEFKKGKDAMKIRRTGTCTSDDGAAEGEGGGDNSNADHQSIHLSPGRSSVSPLDHPECAAGSPTHPLLQHIRHSTSSRSVEHTDTKNNRKEDPPADMTPMETVFYCNEERIAQNVEEEERELREMISALEAESTALALAAEKAIVKAKRVLLDVYMAGPPSFSPLPVQEEKLTSKAKGIMETLEAAEREAVTGNAEDVKGNVQSESLITQKIPKRIVRPQVRGGWENEPSHIQTTRVGKQSLDVVNSAVDVESMEEGTIAASDEGREPKDMNSSVVSQKDREEENVGRSVSLSSKKTLQQPEANDSRACDMPGNTENLTKLQSRLDVLAVETAKSRTDFEVKKEVVVDPILPAAKSVTREETPKPVGVAKSSAPSSTATAGIATSAKSEKVPQTNKNEDADPVYPTAETETHEMTATNVEHGPKAKMTSSLSVKVPELKSTLCDKIEECQAKLSDPNTSISELMDAAKLIEKLAKVVVAMEPIER